LATDGGFWKGRSVFVTGATGFLGGWLVKQLVEYGAEVVVLARDRAPRSLLWRDGLADRVEIVHGGLEDQGLLRRALAEYGVRTVFHLAAQALVRVALQDPVGTLTSNVVGTWNVLEAARQVPVGEVVVASSDKAYGISDRLPYREDHPLQGEFPYEVSKSCADLVCRMYARTYKVPVVVTRCGNLFGGGDLNFSRTIPGVIQSTLAGRPFTIRSDGLYVRDFLFVKDAVLAYLMLAERLAADRSLAGEAFNFSVETRLTVLDVVRSVLQKLGRSDLQPIIQNMASDEIREQYLSADKARARLGWQPSYGFDRGLDETIAWYRTFFEAQERREAQRP
jgi:CDP-glucose 4,6-dehydratase